MSFQDWDFTVAQKTFIASCSPKIAAEFTSILEGIAPTIEKEIDVEKAKKLIIDKIEEAKVDAKMKKKMEMDLNKIPTHERLLIWLWNAILAYKGLKTVKITGSEVIETEKYSGLSLADLELTAFPAQPPSAEVKPVWFESKYPGEDAQKAWKAVFIKHPEVQSWPAAISIFKNYVSHPEKVQQIIK